MRVWIKRETAFKRLSVGHIRSFLLAGSLALSFFLNFWNIDQNGTGNAYCAAAIKNMTQSWHNFSMSGTLY